MPTECRPTLFEFDHDELRHDPVMATLAGKLAARRSDCAPLARARMELGRAEPSRYAKLAVDPAGMEAVFVDLFLDAHGKPPRQITLDLDATDDPLHAHQEDGSFTVTTKPKRARPAARPRRRASPRDGSGISPGRRWTAGPARAA